MTVICALNIFTNPNDLEIVIGQETGGPRFGFIISRGPGHNFRPILSGSPFAKDAEEAIEKIKELLLRAHTFCTKELSNKGSIPSQFLNPDNDELVQDKILNLGLIEKIISELRLNRVASTYKMDLAIN